MSGHCRARRWCPPVAATAVTWVFVTMTPSAVAMAPLPVPDPEAPRAEMVTTLGSVVRAVRLASQVPDERALPAEKVGPSRTIDDDDDDVDDVDDDERAPQSRDQRPGPAPPTGSRCGLVDRLQDAARRRCSLEPPRVVGEVHVEPHVVLVGGEPSAKLRPERADVGYVPRGRLDDMVELDVQRAARLGQSHHR